MFEIAAASSGYWAVNVASSTPNFFSNLSEKISDEAYRIEWLVENTVVLELKSVSKNSELFKKQLWTYLKLADKPCGLLINFNEVLLKDGIIRVMNGYLN